MQIKLNDAERERRKFYNSEINLYELLAEGVEKP